MSLPPDRAEAQARTCASRGTIALSFDDGPDRVWTPRVLDELGHRAARATFFVEAGRAVANPSLIAAMAEAGHEVGFHCVDHVRHSELSDDAVAAEVEEGLRMLATLGVRPGAWRTPWGVVTEATLEVAAEHDLELWSWNFDSHDWRGDGYEEMLAALGAVGGLRDGCVVLMHDGIGPGARRNGCAETVRLTARLLDAAQSAGLRAAPLTSVPAVTR
jgi:peptidoglycan/xylan/chitin deacetylase (PgdA/CDA1 family)